RNVARDGNSEGEASGRVKGGCLSDFLFSQFQIVSRHLRMISHKFLNEGVQAPRQGLPGMGLEPGLPNLSSRIENLRILQKLIDSRADVGRGDAWKHMAKVFHVRKNVDRSDGDRTMRGQTEPDRRAGRL